MSGNAQRGHFERCGNRGPRVGEDVYRCGRPAGHRGNHWPDPHGGWEAITWSEPDRREPAEQGHFELPDPTGDGKPWGSPFPSFGTTSACDHQWVEGEAFDSAGGTFSFTRCERCGITS